MWDEAKARPLALAAMINGKEEDIQEALVLMAETFPAKKELSGEEEVKDLALALTAYVSLNAAKKSDGWSMYEQAIRKEMDAHKKNGTFEVADEDEGRGKRTLHPLLLLSEKADGTKKCRLTVNGKHQENPGAAYSFAPTPRPITVKIFFIVCCHLGFLVETADVSTAFLNALSSVEEYMWAHPVMGYSPGTRLRIVKALYGLKNSANDWYRVVSEEIKEMGFVKSHVDPCFFLKMSDRILVALLLLHVDDFAVGGEDDVVERTICRLGERFDITRERNPTSYTSLQIDYDRKKGIVAMHQSKATNGVLKKHWMLQASAVPTPAIKEMFVRKPATEDEKGLKGQEAYTKEMQSIVGDLNFLLISRPDIALAVNQLARMTNDTQHETGRKMAKRILRYLRGSAAKGLVYNKDDGLELIAASDANHAGDIASRKSQMWVALFLGGCTVEATSRQQNSTAISVFESELISASEAAMSIVHVDKCLKQIGIEVKKPIPLLIDNQSVCDVAATGKKTHRTRHIGVRYFFIREKVEDGLIKTCKAASEDQPADGLTKVMSGDDFKKFSDYFMCDI